MRLLFILGIAIALFSTPAWTDGTPCPPSPQKEGPDFSLPCLPHSPILEEDQKVYFAPGSSDLSDAAKTVLERQAETLGEFPNLTFDVIGFADTREAPTARQRHDLGKTRATVVRDYLIGTGVDAARITATGRKNAPLIPRQADEKSLAAMRFVWTAVREP